MRTKVAQHLKAEIAAVAVAVERLDCDDESESSQLAIAAKLRQLSKKGYCRPCPFCGGKAAKHPNPEWRDCYRVIYHKKGCYLSNRKPPYNFTLLPPCNEKSWNRRADTKST